MQVDVVVGRDEGEKVKARVKERASKALKLKTREWVVV